MKVINQLDRFKSALTRWNQRPTRDQFIADYWGPMGEWVRVLEEDFSHRFGGEFYDVVTDLEHWDRYRAHALLVDPAAEEARVRLNIERVEKTLGLKLEGEVFLFGTFESIDGYARFDRGSHRVFLGVDESYDLGKYIDILTCHELTHVARESKPSVWAPWEDLELSLDMDHDRFSARLPVIEHLYNEGLACVVSERVIPGEPLQAYVYQSAETIQHVLGRAAAIDRVIHAEIEKDAQDNSGEWGHFYNPAIYDVVQQDADKKGLRGSSLSGADIPRAPQFSHYTWAHEWIKALVSQEFGGDLRRACLEPSRPHVQHALKFRLQVS